MLKKALGRRIERLKNGVMELTPPLLDAILEGLRVPFPRAEKTARTNRVERARGRAF